MPHKSRKARMAYYRKWRKDNPNYAAEYDRKLRQKAVDAYGGKCTCCGETRFEFLCIDHVHGGGNEHRKTVQSGTPLLHWLQKRNYPDGFQLLCSNCNSARGRFGRCPHEDED